MTVPGRRLLSLGVLSAALIAYQLALMQLLSLVQWYHFAYMVISVALLGFGAAGTVLAFYRRALLSRFTHIFPLLMLLCSFSMALVVSVSQHPLLRFDSYLLFSDHTHLRRLLLTYLLFLVPFFVGALAIGLAFVKYARRIGVVYFANLLGSGLGGLAALAGFWLLFPQHLPAALALLALLAGLLALPPSPGKALLAGAGIAATISIVALLHPPRLVPSQYKSLSKTLNLPEAKIVLQENSPYGFLQGVTSPALRYAPGLSLAAPRAVGVRLALFNNGNGLGSLLENFRADSLTIIDYSTRGLPYAFGDRRRVLVLNGGSGVDVAQALAHRATAVTAVEPHAVLVSLLQNQLAPQSDSLFLRPGVTLHAGEGRTFILTDTARFDLIVLPTVDTFGGTAGVQALQEQYLLTKAAFRNMWEKLTPEGVVSITSWIDYPLRHPLKVLATLVEVLAAEGVEHPRQHLAAVRSWGTITFVMKRSPISGEDIQQIRHFSRERLFDPAVLPGLRPDERERYNRLQDDRFFSYFEKILAPQQREQFYREYDFNIRPATDNRPYFSQFLRWKSLPRLLDLFGRQTLSFLEIGYWIVVLTLVQITFLAVVLILLPLVKLGKAGGHRLGVVLYFSGLGLGYMFVEIVFIQRFILYFGNPIYAAAAVISSMLVCSGAGSYLSTRISPHTKPGRAIFGAIIGFLMLYALVLTPALQYTISLPIAIKLLMALLFIAPLSVVMGLPFPLGIRRLEKTFPAEIPWAWGINGCLSVVSTALATIVAVEIGFWGVMAFAACAYTLPLLAGLLPFSDF